MQRILVVDDDPAFLAMVCEMLRAAGYEVGAADSGSKALAMMATSPWDLVLCDIIMPDQDGIVTMLAIQKQHPGQKVIAMSGGGRYLLPQTVLEMAQAIAHEVLAKPFPRKVLLETVEDVLKGGREQHGK